MNIKYTLFGTAFLALSAGLFSFNATQVDTISSKSIAAHRVNSSGAPSGRTGAPGEATCTACHGGTIQDGSSVLEINFPNNATTFLPDEIYTLTLNFSAGAAKNGFQLTVLDNTNSKVGTLSNVDNTTSISSFNGRQYLNHTFAGTSQTSWDFQWIAPAISVTDVTFYVAANKTNSNGSTSGDVIYTRSMSFNQDATAGIFELQENKMDFQVGYASKDNSLKLDVNVLEENTAFVSVVDLQGKVVFEKNLGELFTGMNNLSFTMPTTLENGIYVVNFMLGNTSASEKLMITK
ncbi:choice-of-anchor V domain-containing protein [Lishizhenia tianjinensis]|nr:choice-of-anchor V domain-containing protein [Lishizhenia tianjinensis]